MDKTRDTGFGEQISLGFGIAGNDHGNLDLRDDLPGEGQVLGIGTAEDDEFGRLETRGFADIEAAASKEIGAEGGARDAHFDIAAGEQQNSRRAAGSASVALGPQTNAL